MTRFVWSKEYELGIDVIDHQHQRIVDYINRVYDCLESGSSNVSEKEILLNLVDYTFSHVAFEEAMLEEIDYSEIAVHRLSHQSFSRVINDLKERVEQGEKVGKELANFLQNWLIAHIMVEDAKYVDEVNSSLAYGDPLAEPGQTRQAHWKDIQ